MYPPRIEIRPASHFIGLRLQLSLLQNRTPELFRSFMPRRNEISAILGAETYAIDILPPDYYTTFDPGKPFEKWAAIAVPPNSIIPEGMESLEVQEGLYAIFLHKGTAADAAKTYQYILNTWLPSSGYQLENRPTLACMGSKYQNNHPDSEEEIWIPISKK